MNSKLHKENPCWNCKDRSAICHSICERYKAWNEKVVAQRERRYEEKTKKNKTYPSRFEKMNSKKKSGQ